MDDIFELPVELTIYNVHDVRGSLLAWGQARQANGAQPMLVSARRVYVIDGAGLQVLAALDQMHSGWKLSDASSAFADACRVMGLERWLLSPHLISAEGART